MTRSLAPITALLYAVALLIAGTGLYLVLLPLRANREAFAPLANDIMGGAYFCALWRRKRSRGQVSQALAEDLPIAGNILANNR